MKLLGDFIWNNFTVIMVKVIGLENSCNDQILTVQCWPVVLGRFYEILI